MVPKSRTDCDPIPDQGVTRCPSATGFQKVFDGIRTSSRHGRHEKNLGSRSRSARPRRRALTREPLREPRASVDVRHVVHPFGEPTRAARGIVHRHQATELLNTLVSGPYLWIAFGSILVCVAAAIAIAGIGERTRHFGTFGIIVLLLYAALLYIAAYQYNQQAAAGDAAISIGYGLIVAVG